VLVCFLLSFLDSFISYVFSHDALRKHTHARTSRTCHITHVVSRPHVHTLSLLLCFVRRHIVTSLTLSFSPVSLFFCFTFLFVFCFFCPLPPHVFHQTFLSPPPPNAFRLSGGGVSPQVAAAAQSVAALPGRAVVVALEALAVAAQAIFETKGLKPDFPLKG
jgi:hypothetical protein